MFFPGLLMALCCGGIVQPKSGAIILIGGAAVNAYRGNY